MSLLRAFSRLNLQNLATASSPRYITTSSILYAEPLKKKKKIDPAIIKQREERKRKKLEKQIRRLEKNARQLKPIEELEVPLELLDQKEQRARKIPKLSVEEIERRALLNKQWAKYKHEEKVVDFQIIDRVMQSQKKALEELRRESEELYQEAIQMDLKILPFSCKGPVATPPPIEGYASPDGDYINHVRKWD